MSLHTDRCTSSLARPSAATLGNSLFAATAAVVLACSASGNQFLGTVIPDTSTATDAGPPATDAAGGCLVTRNGALEELRSDLDIYFTIDRSQQSFTPDQWDGFVSGFTRFLHSDRATGVGMGIAYFPAQSGEGCGSRCMPGDCSCLMACGCDCDPRFDPRSCQRASFCDATAYQRPDVEIAPLPQNAGALATSLFVQNPFGSRTIRPALKGSLDHLASFEGSHPDRAVEVLLVGGQPSFDCQQGSIADCADAAAASNVKTFVVAIDTGESPFDPIAARGGTDHALQMDGNRDVEGQLAELVAAIRGVSYCEYALPEPGLDYRSVNVDLTAPADAGLNSSTFVSRVKDRASCNNVRLGWYFDRGRIVACDETCRRIRAGMQAGVRFCAPSPP